MTKLLDDKRVKEHPWAKSGMVVQFPIDMLKTIANQNATNETDLLCGKVVAQEDVWNDIIKTGMAEPLLIVIGYKQKTIRLESGNHRVNLAYADGFTHLPVVIQVINESIYNKGNGEHYICAESIVNWGNIVKCPYPVQVNPCDVINISEFKSILKTDSNHEVIEIN